MELLLAVGQRCRGKALVFMRVLASVISRPMMASVDAERD
jgi:hypothetical protein